MEEIIDLLSAYYTTLLENGYIDQKGQGTSQLHEPYNFSFFLAAPWRAIPDNVNMDHASMTRLVEDGYYFWLFTRKSWNWICYKNGQWNDGTIIPEDKMPEIIQYSADLLELELQVEPTSEMSMAARLLDDEMQYEI